MKLSWFYGLIAALPLQAQITEPNAVLYGKVTNPNSPAPFRLQHYAGTLSWTIQAAATGKSQTFTTQLTSWGNGEYSYRLLLPQHALGGNLAGVAGSLPLTGSPTKWIHQAITINGSPARLAAPAVTFLSAQQSLRAATYRIDLELNEPVPDSDGDQIPDWWEDHYGLDKWDDSDAAPILARLTGAGRQLQADETQVIRFDQWRALYFPGASGSLDQFGEEDPDHDGLPNLLEYAFGLHPLNPATTAAQLPQTKMEGGRVVFSFPRRAAASDLIYTVESSEDLGQWQEATPHLQALSADASASGISRSVFLCNGTQDSQRFFRVNVRLR